jgi:hypothetical protein
MEEIKSKLKKEAEMLHDTIGWWKAEMLKVMSECSKMEDKNASGEYSVEEFEIAKEDLQNKLKYLLLKGEWENRELQSFQNKVDVLEKSGLKLGIKNIGFKIDKIKDIEDQDS